MALAIAISLAVVDNPYAHKKNDAAACIEARDKGHAHIVVLYEILTGGIVKQFPKMFMK
ncbi:MAG: hypothetical protein L7F78_10345 [Syntrophales bacterium LBB04]|nr:hypothetical protein [Syntrophales bacterium LBB04]